MHVRLAPLALAVLIGSGLAIGACSGPAEEADSGSGAESEAMLEADPEMVDAPVDAEAADDTDADAVEDAEEAGMAGMQHRYMQDAMHETMLRQAVELGIFTEDDASFFSEAHAAIEPYQPEGAGQGMGRRMEDEGHKSMQRAVAGMAVADGAMSQEDADRFTELHDLLVENGLMEESGEALGMGEQRGTMQAAMHDAMLSKAIERGLIDEADAELFLRVHAVIETYQPEGMAMGASYGDEARQAMQRGFTEQAVEAGELSREDADRFTEIHDLLIDEGLMEHE